MTARPQTFDGPLTELDYARAIDPLSRYGSAMASFFKGIAWTCGIVAVSTAGFAVAYSYYKPRRTVKIPPEDQIRIGILGTGWGITVQLPQFQKAGLQVSAIFSRGHQRARQVAEQNCVPHYYSSAEDLCACQDVDVVSIVTPPYLHCQHFLAALEAGKHVVCDKPMALNGDEAERMLEASQQHPGQVAIVDHELRFTPMVQLAREHLQAGLIGQVCWVDITLTLPAPSGGRKWDWWADEAQGGGVVGAFGSHAIDLLRFILQAEVSSVSAHLKTLASPLQDRANSEIKDATSEDYASVQLTLTPQPAASSGVWGCDHPARPPYQQPHDDRMPEVQAHMTMALAGKATRQTQVVFGADSGGAVLNLSDGSLSITDQHKQVVASGKGSGSPYQHGTQLLGAALQQALGPAADASALQHAASIADGLAVQYVIDAIRASSRDQGALIRPQHVQEKHGN